MRISGGGSGGRRIKATRGQAVRPTGEKARQAVFNILGDAVVGARFLDLFAGTGAMGLEALSRGAGAAVFVERDRRAAALIRDNARAAGLADRAEVLVGDAFRLVGDLAARGPFDLVYCDPPYGVQGAGTLLVAVATAAVRPTGIVILEREAARPGPQPGPPLVEVDRRRYGRAEVVFFRP